MTTQNPPVGSWDYVRWAAQTDNNASPIMGSGAWWFDKTKQADPTYWLLGGKRYGKIHEFLAKTGPEQTNRILKPIASFHRKYLDPLQWFVPKDSSLQQAPDYAENKSGDVIAAVLGAYAGGAALGGAGGGGSGGSSGGFNAMNMMGGMPNMGSQQQQPPRMMARTYIPGLLDFGGSPTPVRKSLLRG